MNMTSQRKKIIKTKEASQKWEAFCVLLLYQKISFVIFIDIKLSLPFPGIHLESITQWDNYNACKIPCPTTVGHLPAGKQV